MDDDYDAVLAQPARQLTTINGQLEPLVETVRAALADSPLFQLRINEATPEQRAEIVRMRATIDAIATPLNVRLKSLNESAKIAFAKTGSTEFPVAGADAIKLTKPQTDYIVEVEQLREALAALIPQGFITKAEIDKAITPYTAYKPDHRLLNYLAAHRGDEVAAAIHKHRRKPEVDASRMRVEWPKEKK